MVYLSTASISPELGTRERCARLLRFDVSGFELDCRLPVAELEALANGLRAADHSVVSLHNFCPLPREFKASRAGPDVLLPSSLDPEERARVVQASRNTLEWAARLEATAVVVHCGHVTIDYDEEEIRGLYEAGKWRGQKAARIIDRLKKRRREAAARHFDSVCLCLDRILKDAVRLEIPIAIKNRRSPHEIPDREELQALMAEFRGAPLGTWFDLPYAEHQGMLQFEDPALLWKAMEPDLLGIHVHDLRGFENRLPPGAGELDLAGFFERCLDRGGVDVPIVVDCRAERDEEIHIGIKHLCSLLGESPEGEGDFFLPAS